MNHVQNELNLPFYIIIYIAMLNNQRVLHEWFYLSDVTMFRPILDFLL